MMANYLKQALHLPVAIVREHIIVGVSEVRRMEVRTNLNLLVALKGYSQYCS